MQSQQDNASLIAQLDSQRGKHGLDSRHDFVLAKQHPGAEGTTISRADHTFKGVRIFSSESVVVSGPHGSIISESIADRRSGLNQNDINVGAGDQRQVGDRQRGHVGGAGRRPRRSSRRPN